MPKLMLDILHWGTGLTLIAVGGLATLGVSLTGVVVSDPKVVFGAGVGIIVAGLKGNAVK